MNKTLRGGPTQAALLLAWWALKQSQPTLDALDVAILAGLAASWLVDRKKGEK